MSASAESRVRPSAPGRILAMLLGVVALFPACTQTPAPPPPPATQRASAASASLADPAALLLRDPVDATDPGAEPVIAMVRANLAQFEVAATDLGRTAPLTPARRAILGPTATVRALRAATRVEGEARPVAHTIWVTTTTDAQGRPRLAGLADAPTPATDPVPLWLLEPVTVARAPGAAVVATRTHDPASWLDGLQRAAVDLRAAGLSPATLVAELPSNTHQLERLVATPALRTVGAACWAFGDGTRIVVNPGPGAATTGSGRQFLLTHESVHAATDSPHHRWPAWFVEGYADHVAAAAHPDVAAVLDAQLGAALRAGAPASLPTDAELDPTRADVATAYARARIGVRVLGDAATRIQADLSEGATFDDALRKNGWTQDRLAAATAAELGRRKG
ncbi:hypothetical protein [Mariniluteicoccus flavus]